MPHSRETMISLAHDNLLGIFGERDTKKRLENMQKAYAEDITFYEPDQVTKGYAGISKICQILLDGVPDWVFKPAGPVWITQDMVMLDWQFGPEGGEPKVNGRDVMLVNNADKIEKLYVVIERRSDVHKS